MQPFFESVQVKIWCGRTCASAWSACQPQHIVAGERFHWSGASASVVPGFTPHAAEQRQRRSACMQSGSSTRPLCFHWLHQHEREGARWTCWYSCRENMQVLSATDSLVLLFVFVLKSLLSLLFTSRYTMEAFLIFLILLLFDSSVFAKQSVMY